jgi:hypothetical protein
MILIKDVTWMILPEDEIKHTIPFFGFTEDGEPFEWSLLNGKMSDVIIIFKDKK